MKPLIIAGNWKSNKTASESEIWLQNFRIERTNVTVILCVPFTLLSVMKKGSFSLGAQDISPFEEGAYTGEISGKMIKEFADWVIIGHSERRKYFGETDDLLAKKAERAKSAGLKIIYCVPDDTTRIPAGVDVVAYEPVWAIGSGKSETPENANSVIVSIKAKSQVSMAIYGGSVTAENVAAFTVQPAIDGVLPGGASLDPEKFAALIRNAK